MPLIEYMCKKGHLAEDLYLNRADIPKERQCGHRYGNGKLCLEIAEKQVSAPNSLFQPYAFSADGFASYSDRKGLFTSPDPKFSLGTASDKKRTENPNRQFSHFKGVKVA
jgi:hypothetical protein